MAFDIGKPESAPLVFVGEFFVVNTEQMQHSGLKIVHVNRILYYVVSEIIRFSVQPWFNTAPGHIDAKAARMVVAPIVVGGKCSLLIIGAPEFSAPYDKRIFQKAALFQIHYKSCRGLIYIFGLTSDG